MPPSACHGQRCTSSVPPHSPCHRLARSRSEQITCPFTRLDPTIPSHHPKRNANRDKPILIVNSTAAQSTRSLTPTFFNPQLTSTHLTSTYLIQHLPVSTPTPHHFSSRTSTAPPRPRPIVYAPTRLRMHPQRGLAQWGRGERRCRAGPRIAVGCVRWHGMAWEVRSEK
jgi:hypothetical protein